MILLQAFGMPVQYESWLSEAMQYESQLSEIGSWKKKYWPLVVGYNYLWTYDFMQHSVVSKKVDKGITINSFC